MNYRAKILVALDYVKDHLLLIQKPWTVGCVEQSQHHGWTHRRADSADYSLKSDRGSMAVCLLIDGHINTAANIKNSAS